MPNSLSMKMIIKACIDHLGSIHVNRADSKTEVSNIE